MNEGWQERKWGDEISLEYGKSLKGYKNSNGKVPVFGSNGQIGWTDTSPLCNEPGIILGRKGAYRGVKFSNSPFYVIDTAYYIKLKGNIDINWLYYAIIYYRLGEIDDGSPIPSTTRSAVYVRKFKLPPLPEQKNIAHILGTLDDKIELNRQMNATLEQMAQALFKSWFVDFDPVLDNALTQGNPIPEALQTKAERRKAVRASGSYKPLPSEIQALFPSHFVFSEALEKWVPEGWEVGCIGDVALNSRNSIKPKEIKNDTPYIGLQDMPQRSIALSEWKESDEIASSKYCFQKGDILFGKLRPYFHKVGIAPLNGICSTDILVIKPKNNDYLSLVLGHLISTEFIDFVTAASTGTRMPRTNWKDMSSYFIVIPQEELIKKMTEIISIYLQKIACNVGTIKIFAKLRDTLLPQLISGKLSVADWEAKYKAV